MIDIWEISNSYTLRLSNLLLIALVFAFYFITKKILHKLVDRFSFDKEVIIKGKEFSFHVLINQVLIIISLFFLYGALGFDNPQFALSKFLNFEFLSKNAQGEGVRLSIGQLVGVAITIFITKIVINVLKLFITKSFGKKDWIDEDRKNTIIQLFKYVIFTICIIVILKIIFGNISNVLLGASALFVGLGLGLQEFFTDVVSGFILLNDGSIKVGDIVEMHDSTVAKVKQINIRTSHIKTTEGKIIIVPNSKFTEELVTNWSVSDKVTRFHINVSVAYGTDTSLVKELLYKAALTHPKVQKTNDILIVFEDFGDNGLEFKLFFWANQTWDIIITKSDIRFTIDQLFRDNNIRIPFPQRDLHIINTDRGQVGGEIFENK